MNNKYEIVGDSVKIQIKKDVFAFIDIEDLPRVKAFSWTLVGGGYARGMFPSNNGKREYIKMHSLVTSFPVGLMVDHKNRNKLDNRKSNLRLCTQKQNSYNVTRPRSKTGMVGVQKHHNRYQAVIQNEGVNIYLGAYDCKIEAAKAYDKKCIELRGEYAVTNF